MGSRNDRDLRRAAGIPSGPITDLIRFPRSPLDFRFHVVTARIHESYESCLAESVARCVASGVSDDPRIAEAAAIGEAWERIAFVDAVRRLRQAQPAPCPPSLSADDIFSLPFLLEPGADRRAWAHDAIDSPVAILRYREYAAGERPVEREIPAGIEAPGAYSTILETTNGLACAQSFEVALDRAVRELVERDALMLVWLTRSGGRRVSPEPYLKPAHCEQIARLSELGIKTLVRDISTGFGIRVFLVAVVATFPGRRIGIAFGAGAHLDPRQAVYHAFREACLSWRGVAWRSLTGDRPSAGGMPSSFSAHGEYYSSWDRMHLLDFLTGEDAIDAGPASGLDIEAPLSDSGHLDMLLDRGLRVLATDITPPQAADTGLVVVQAVVPGLVPLYLGDRGANALAWNRLPTSIGDMPRHPLKPDRSRATSPDSLFALYRGQTLRHGRKTGIAGGFSGRHVQTVRRCPRRPRQPPQVLTRPPGP